MGLSKHSYDHRTLMEELALYGLVDKIGQAIDDFSYHSLQVAD